MVLRPALTALSVLALAGACRKDTGDWTSTSPEPAPKAVDPVAHDGAVHGSSRPAPAPGERDDEDLYVDGVRMRLQPAACTLTATFLDQELGHRFEFPGACHFAPGPDGQPWLVSTDHGKAVLVVGSVPTEGNSCNTALQVVVVTERGPALSREVQHVSGCGPGPWDEMMYHVLASDRVDLGTGP